jgi:protein tyrosine/serine phosphatase
VISNFRDIGGCKAAGGFVRTGVLYRSASLANLTDAGTEHLTKLGIRTVIDMRRAEEVATYGRIVDATGRRYVNVPPTHGRWDEPPYDEAAGPARYLADRYVELARDGANEYAVIMRMIADDGNAPLVVHCFAGKDRTGVLIALTLALLGVADADIATDYARSDEWSRTAAPPGIPGHWLVAPPEAILLFLDDVRETYGDLHGYATSAGLAEADVAALREALVR